MEVEKPKVSDLISLSLFQLDSRVSSSKEALWRSLVETAMYYEAKSLSRQQVCDAVRHLLEQPKMNITEEVGIAIDAGLVAGTLAQEDNVFKLTSIGEAHLDAMVKRAKADEQQFDSELGKCCCQSAKRDTF